MLFPDSEPPRVVDAIARHRITDSFLVPAVIQFMLQVPDVDNRDYSSPRYISYGAPPITERALVDGQLDGSGWFRSGDAGYMRDGFLFLHDRIRDMILAGGAEIVAWMHDRYFKGRDRRIA